MPAMLRSVQKQRLYVKVFSNNKYDEMQGLPGLLGEARGCIQGQEKGCLEIPVIRTEANRLTACREAVLRYEYGVAVCVCLMCA